MKPYNTQTNSFNNQRYVALIEENMSVNPFGQNTVSDRAYKKTEKLALATYLLTNHMDADEPLKARLREHVDSLITLIAESATQNIFDNESALTPVLAKVRIILTELDLLFVAGLASEMNVRVLKNAYADFASYVRSGVGTEGAKNVDLQGFLQDVDGLQAAKATKPSATATPTVATTTKATQTADKVKSTTADITKRPVRRNGSSVRTQAISTNRRVVILDMAAKKGKVTVKEIAAQIPDTSPKTLQRELNTLVHEGTLRKEGSKRWTVYTLA